MRHSEAVLAVNPGSESNPLGFHDQDPLLVLNGRDISEHHVRRILNVASPLAPRNGTSWLLIRGTPFESFYIETYEKRFQRVAFGEVEVTNLITREQTIVTEVPNRNGEMMRVPRYVRDRRKRRDHRLFGSEGREVWYGGYKDFSDPKLSTLWAIIEGNTPERQTSNERFPFNRKEQKQNLILALEDMTDAEKWELMLPDFDRPKDLMNREIIRKRGRRVPYRTIDLGVTVEDVENRRKRIDIVESRLFVRNDVVEVKAPVDVPRAFLLAMAARTAERNQDGV